jgi:hypothetical protein
MKTTGDILDKLYPIIAVSSVLSLIDGRVYRRKRPLNSTTKDIELQCLPIDGGEALDVQRALVIVNIYAKNFDNGIADETTLKSISAAVITALESYAGSTAEYFEIDIQSESIMQDPDDPAFSYDSIRIMCEIEA